MARTKNVVCLRSSRIKSRKIGGMPVRKSQKILYFSLIIVLIIFSNACNNRVTGNKPLPATNEIRTSLPPTNSQPETEKSKSLPSTNTQQEQAENSITSLEPQDSQIKEKIGNGWDISDKKMLSFMNQSNYCVVLARQKISEFSYQCKITLLKYDKNNSSWVQLKDAPEQLIKDRIGISINVLEKPEVDLVAVQLANGGSAGYTALLFFSITDQGNVQNLDNHDFPDDMSYIANVKVNNNMIIADGLTSVGRHEISFDGKQIQDHKIPLSKMGDQIKNAIIVSFQLQNW